MRRLSKESKDTNNKNYKIIAVDDEIGIIDSLSIFLKHSGYTLLWFNVTWLYDVTNTWRYCSRRN